MSISLVKGQKLGLTKTRFHLDYLHIGIDWQTASGLDIDASAFLLDNDEKVIKEEDFIFYGQPHSSNKSVRLEDSLSTIEKQRFITSLSKIPDEIQKISFTLTIYEAKLKGYTFSDVTDIKLRLISSQTQEEIAVFPISYAFTRESAIVLGTLYRYSNEWKFHAVGAGFNGGLADLCREYGLDVIEEAEATTTQMKPVNVTDRFQNVQERDMKEPGEAIPPKPVEQLELKRSSMIQFDQSRIKELSEQSTTLVQLFEEPAEFAQGAAVVETSLPDSLDLIADVQMDTEEFIASLTEPEATFLTKLTNGQIHSEEANLFFRENLTMPAVFLNRINEKANEYLGENLLLEEREVILADEEFRFIIEEIKERNRNEY